MCSLHWLDLRSAMRPLGQKYINTLCIGDILHFKDNQESLCSSSARYMYIALVLCFYLLGILVPPGNFSLISLTWRRHYNRGRATNFDLYSAFMAIELWRFFSVLHLLWYRLTLCNWSSSRTLDNCNRAFVNRAVPDLPHASVLLLLHRGGFYNW